jgi:hypothetical protein
MTFVKPSDADQPATACSRRRDFLFGAVILACVLTGLAAMTWRKWGDMLIDFGVQLYIPWKISTGSVLYRDIAYMTGGPLSQYFDAALFRAFGASYLTLALANLGFLAVLLFVVYFSFYHAAGRLTALMSSLALLLVFAFSNYSDYGIFNYVTPYSQEIYHGLVLSVVALAFLAKWIDAPKPAGALASGFFCGLVFLTKCEVFLALAAAVLAAVGLAVKKSPQPRAVWQGLSLMAAAAVLPLLAFVIYFLRVANFPQSLKWSCGAWMPLLTSSAVDSPFYRWCLGLKTPGWHIARTFGDSAVVTSLVTFFAFVFRPRRPGRRDALILALLTGALAVLAWSFDWVECAHSLPLLCLVTLFWLLRRSRPAPPPPFMVLWTVFSLVLLAKLGLYGRIWHYGFVLAMPAFLTAIYLILQLVPEYLERLQIPRNRWCAFASILLAVGFVQLILFSKYIYQQKTVKVGQDADTFYTFPEDFRPTGALMTQAITWMKTNTSATSTVAVLPAGVMVNYILRRPNPTPYLRWNPPEMAVFGQSNMTRAVEQAAPDYILLLGVDTREFGIDYFGQTDAFGRGLVQWINQHYRPVWFAGHNWTKDDEFGLEILQRSSD